MMYRGNKSGLLCTYIRKCTMYTPRVLQRHTFTTISLLISNSLFQHAIYVIFSRVRIIFYREACHRTVSSYDSAAEDVMVVPRHGCHFQVPVHGDRRGILVTHFIALRGFWCVISKSRYRFEDQINSRHCLLSW